MMSVIDPVVSEFEDLQVDQEVDVRSPQIDIPAHFDIVIERIWDEDITEKICVTEAE